MSEGVRFQLAMELHRAIQRSTMWTVLMNHTVAGKTGINVTDAQAVNLLSLDGPMTPGQLAQSMGITTGGAITAVVDRLEKAGLVKRSRDPDDRRKVIVELVPDSFARIAAYFRPIVEETNRILASYSDDQLRLVLDFTRAANDAMPDIIKKVQEMD
jgi:DNA-binding MarR family transcriptional regulator